MKIYLAARYGRRLEMQAVAETLKRAGHEVTAQWVWGAEELPGYTPEMNAQMDVDDVARADCVISFTEEKGSLNKGGGRHWEMGLAYAYKKQLICVGPKEIIFHHLPEVQWFDNLEACLLALAPRPVAELPVLHDSEPRD